MGHIGSRHNGSRQCWDGGCGGGGDNPKLAKKGFDEEDDIAGLWWWWYDSFTRCFDDDLAADEEVVGGSGIGEIRLFSTISSFLLCRLLNELVEDVGLTLFNDLGDLLLSLFCDNSLGDDGDLRRVWGIVKPVPISAPIWRQVLASKAKGLVLVSTYKVNIYIYN